MGFDKLLAPVLGKPVLQWSLDAFLQADSVDRIVVVTSEERFEALEVGTTKQVLRVDGDRERFHSVARGLQAITGSPTYVAVHDGARPLVLPEQSDECVQVARDAGAAALARRVTETLKKADGRQFTRSSPISRENLWIMETPQVFRFNMLCRAYTLTESRRLHITDDVSAAEAIGVPTKLIENPLPNPKITFPRDLTIVEALLRIRKEEGTG